MLSKSQIKLITSLQLKKYRNLHGLFVVEGVKGVNEFLQAGFKPEYIICKNVDCDVVFENKIVVNDKVMQTVSSLKNASPALGVFHVKEVKGSLDKGLILALDDIRDPGNLGTIIRLCDWFGIESVVCSNETVDCYNPKVVQATMGSLARVRILYTDLEIFLNEYNGDIYGAFMEGENIYNETLALEGVIVMGNEANGISESIQKVITKRVAIPRYGNTPETESLNVAMATSIILSEFRRGFPIGK